MFQQFCLGKVCLEYLYTCKEKLDLTSFVYSKYKCSIETHPSFENLIHVVKTRRTLSSLFVLKTRYNVKLKSKT